MEQLRESEAELVDVSYAPDCFSDKPLSHAALLVDFLHGKLEPYELAHRNMLELASRMRESYNDAAGYAVCFPELDEKVRLLSARRATLDTYAACANLFELEALILTAVHAAGSHLEMEALKALLNGWLETGVLTVEQARALANCAPVTRWGEDWFTQVN